MNIRRRYFALAGAAAVAAGGIAFAAPAAEAASTLSVTLSACGTGSSAVWNSAGNPVLTIGTAPAATCGAPSGSTHDPAFAQIGINGVAGQPTPTPSDLTSFHTDHYHSGSPRFVIFLNNGHSLWGYPPESALNGTDMAWAVDNGNTYTSYAVAYNGAGGAATTVKQAFVVEDTDQVPGTVDTITGLTFGGNTLPAGADVVTVTNPGSQSSTVGTADSLQLSASSSKGDGIALFAVSGLPTGLSLNTTTGKIAGTPTTAGNQVVTVTSTDNGGTVSAPVSFAWNVQAATVPPPPPVVSNNVVIRNRLSGKCLNEDQHTGLLSQFTCSGAFVSLQWRTVRLADGTTYLQSVQTGQYVTSGTQGAQLMLSSTRAGHTTAFQNGGIFRFPNGLVMDDKGRNRSNFAAAIGWAFNGQDNQRWDFQKVPA